MANDKIYCSKCGAENEVGSSFCKKCGVDLRGASAEKPSNWWYLLPILLGILGGILGYIYFSTVIKVKDEKMAKNILYVGLGTFVLGIIFIAAVPSPPPADTEVPIYDQTSYYNGGIYDTTPPPVAVTPAVVQKAEPYISEIVFEDLNLRTLAATIVSGCPSGDKECQINKLYRYVIENYNYYSDPRNIEFIQSPYETMKVKGGDCEDLTILLSSLLENLGVKTYMVLTEDHAYCLACDVDTDDLWQYIQESIITQVAQDLGQKEDMKVVIENGNLFVVQEEQQTFVLDAGHLYYYGGDGSKFTSPIEYMDIKHFRKLKDLARPKLAELTREVI